MKLTLIEKILWAIYNFLETVEKVHEKVPGTRRVPWYYDERFRLRRYFQRQRSRQKFAQFINDLKRKGYIKTKIEKSKRVILLTPKGLGKILQISLKQTIKDSRQDKKWLMVIFDIPEKYRKTRNRFRAALKILDYQKLQKSVWICPFDVLKETERIIRLYSLESYTRLFLIEKIKSD